MYEIIILIRAEQEVDETAEYYESLSNGLGTKFFNEYQDYVDTLITFPFFEEKYKTVRTLPLRKFPYTIHFTVDENKKIVFILALTSNYQDPNITRIK
ncbi:type II toxin-antitoxin system RelE/ParE family toxin [Flavobacterium pectinovorum]|uniref:Type II toxin-antitoxin system RelE/ParE family toxin n=1 Tax=Flavobacterium pectinovorum TaxID=29533 RepID=A0AB36NY78_9FLAO|nr:type II toxin-antitoxin system RelE/ParE family toxin [Flavobacterium pectinovorum]OXB02697.1 hypothetical protein B0A72_16065 [Flavobacterium pectinovorum]SHL95944.1 hypothetical protein SAMN05444387_1548 [Flavobacterium pectinovorum]